MGGGILHILLVILLLLSILELIAVYVLPLTSVSSVTYYPINETIPFIIGYSVPFILGIVVRDIDKKMNIEILAFFLILLCATIMYYVVNKGYFNPNSLKAGPHAGFMVYGVTCSLILWNSKKLLAKLADIRLIVFIGQNTMWIYLWHILFVQLSSFISAWELRYIFVIVSSLITYYLQFYLARKFLENKWLYKYLIG